MNVAVQDLHRVIAAARKLGGQVVLGGHSLGGSVVAAYATWNFGGHPGARDLAGLVFIDGSSFRTETAAQARTALHDLNAPKATPWLTFGSIPSPFAGLFVMTGSEGALIDPNSPSTGQAVLAPAGWVEAALSRSRTSVSSDLRSTRPPTRTPPSRVWRHPRLISGAALRPPARFTAGTAPAR